MLQASGQGGSMMGFWVMIIALFAIMYFFMIRPQQKKQKQINEFRKGLQVGQEVMTAGGIHGTIREIDGATNTVTLEIAKDVKIKVEKGSIYSDASMQQQR